MKTDKAKRFLDKGFNVVIIALVVMGTAAVGLVNQLSEGGEVLSKLFLIFFGTIIAVQIIPGLFLLGAMLKGLASHSRKEELAADTKVDDDKNL